MYRVVVHHRAANYLKRLPQPQKKRIKKLLHDLALNPSNHPNVKSMVGEWAGYRRFRVGDIRIIFWVENSEETIYVDYVGPRGDVYK
ncbi:MAG: mRNA interferase RelE/StbE [Acidobacteriota bacterium]|nr:mRNA interferase RelE/StbE [Acidobacteriota bacterium]